MSRTFVYLVPGFFGFTSLGALNYFHRVKDTLDEFLVEQGVDATIVECRTQPTGSIRNRADRLLDVVMETGGLEAEHVHFVGHSTGGLDTRLVATPGVMLRESDVEERLGELVRSVVTVSTPHFGTPLANFFTTFQGRYLLQVLTLLATTKQGRYGLFAMSQLLSVVADVDDRLGRDRTVLDSISDNLLNRITLDPDDPVWDFLEEISKDQGAIIQLTPEGMNLYAAAVTDRPGVDYHSVLTAAPPPFAHRIKDVIQPHKAAMAAAFAMLYKLAARQHSHYPYPHPAHELCNRIAAQLPFPLDSTTNDGIVPTLSQIHGSVLHTVVGDHLDVVGQFTNAGGNPLSDWLPSGSRFSEDRFRETWRRIAGAIADAEA